MGTASCDDPAIANSVHGANLAVAGGIHIQTVAKPSRRVAYGAIGLHTTVSPKGVCMPAVAVMRAFILFDFIRTKSPLSLRENYTILGGRRNHPPSHQVFVFEYP